jgi:AAA+ ATPase superfamily predicted ATPase
MYATFMPEDFVGRSNELRVLKEELKRVQTAGSGRLVALRGRRQVGKSRLVEHFATHSGVRYGVIAGMRGTPVEVQTRRAVETLRSSVRPLEDLGAVDVVFPANWYDLLSRLRLAVGRGPAIVVFDEFPWAEATNPGLDGLLQSLWDLDLSRLPLLVVLVGSDEAMMEQLFEHDRPLFGRVNSHLVVNPFNPAETALVLGGAPNAMKTFDAQLVTGGFPELVLHARRFPSVDRLVTEALSRPHTLLADIAQIDLAGELADGGNARLVLEAIGADETGVVNFSRIVSLLGGGTASETAVSRAAEILINSKGIVAVDNPSGSRSTRLRRYRIGDSYLRFWFRFMEPHLRNIEVGRSDLAVAAFHSSWSTWRGKAIEPLVREGVLRLAPRLGSPYDTITTVDAWWDRKGSAEYDLVACARGGPLAIGSVKWRERGRFNSRDLARLAEGRATVPYASGARLVAVAPQGAAQDVNADLVIDAAALLSAWDS